jgi:hypothetical protein
MYANYSITVIFMFEKAMPGRGLDPRGKKQYEAGEIVQ